MPRPRLLLLAASLHACSYVTEKERAARWDLDGDGVERPADCDDADPGRGARGTRFADLDGDGFGDELAPLDDCALDAAAERGGDCDDADPDRHPGADERCDGADDDCDGTTDEDLEDREWFRDLDADGFGDAEVSETGCVAPEGYVVDDRDCDDHEATVHPEADELCGEVDEDCDGLTAEDPDLVVPTWFPDDDRDGHGRAGPGQVGCDAPGGAWATEDDDCDDTDDQVHPGVAERCDGVDEDCDGQVDEDAEDRLRFYADGDDDGYGDATVSELACPPPDAGWVANASDCDDTTDQVHPGADECLDGVDDDCDGQVDETSCP